MHVIAGGLLHQVPTARNHGKNKTTSAKERCTAGGSTG